MQENKHESNNAESAVVTLKKPFSLKSPHNELKEVCQINSKHRYAEEMFTRWHNLREASLKLTALLTKHWPDTRLPDSGSFLVNIINHALTEAEEVYQSKDGMAEHNLNADQFIYWSGDYTLSELLEYNPLY
jgi:hypothetical protein